MFNARELVFFGTGSDLLAAGFKIENAGILQDFAIPAGLAINEFNTKLADKQCESNCEPIPDSLLLKLLREYDSETKIVNRTRTKKTCLSKTTRKRRH